MVGIAEERFFLSDTFKFISEAERVRIMNRIAVSSGTDFDTF